MDKKILFFIVFLAFASVSFASTYGSGNYGDDLYGLSITVTPSPGDGGGGGGSPYFFLQSESKQLPFDKIELIVIKYNVTNTRYNSGIFSPKCVGDDCEFVFLQPGFTLLGKETKQTFFMVRIPPNFTRTEYNFNITSVNYANNSLNFNLSLSDELILSILKGKGITLADYDLVLEVTNPAPICLGDTIDYNAFMLSNNIPSQDVVLRTYLADASLERLTPDETNTLFVKENTAISKALSINTRQNWEQGYYRLVGNIDNYTDPTNTIFYLEDCTQIQRIPILGQVIDVDWIKILKKPIDIGFIQGLEFWIVSVIIFIGCFVVSWLFIEKHRYIVLWTLFLWLLFSGIVYVFI